MKGHSSLPIFLWAASASHESRTTVITCSSGFLMYKEFGGVNCNIFSNFFKIEIVPRDRYLDIIPKDIYIKEKSKL